MAGHEGFFVFVDYEYSLHDVTFLFSAFAGKVRLAYVSGWFDVNRTCLDPQHV